MSLNDEERKTLVALELKKANETFEEIGILTTANPGVVLPTDFIMRCTML